MIRLRGELRLQIGKMALWFRPAENLPVLQVVGLSEGVRFGVAEDSPSHWVIADWRIPSNGDTPDLRFVGARPFDPDGRVSETFLLLAETGQRLLKTLLVEETP